ncbi:Unknown protein, partial [Striga hermonthica]
VGCTRVRGMQAGRGVGSYARAAISGRAGRAGEGHTGGSQGRIGVGMASARQHAREKMGSDRARAMMRGCGADAGVLHREGIGVLDAYTRKGGSEEIACGMARAWWADARSPVRVGLGEREAVHADVGDARARSRARQGLDNLLTRFGTSNYHNYNEALTRIRQIGNLRDYLKEFERLACRVRGWPETVLVGAFIGGLKFYLAAEVRLERPETMHAAMEVARRREDHLVATRRGRADARYPETRHAQPDASNMVPSGGPPDTSRPPVPEVKRLSLEEIKRRREKGLCFKCDEKFTLGHQCKQAFVIHVIGDEEPEIEEDWKQEVEIGVPEEEAEISMHAMAGTKGPKTMRLPACVKDRRIVVLVDNGSSHNFINATLSQKNVHEPIYEGSDMHNGIGGRARCSRDRGFKARVTWSTGARHARGSNANDAWRLRPRAFTLWTRRAVREGRMLGGQRARGTTARKGANTCIGVDARKQDHASEGSAIG